MARYSGKDCTATFGSLTLRDIVSIDSDEGGTLQEFRTSSTAGKTDHKAGFVNRTFTINIEGDVPSGLAIAQTGTITLKSSGSVTMKTYSAVIGNIQFGTTADGKPAVTITGGETVA